MAGRRHGPPDAEDLEKTWRFLEEGIAQIMETLDQGMSYVRSMELSIYNFCTQNKMQRLGDSSTTNRAHLMGGELYERLMVYIKTHLDSIRVLKGETLLQHYSKEWQDYTAGAGLVHHIFKYLNRHWVKREMDEGKQDVYDVYTLCLVLWHKQVFEAVNANLIAAVLEMIEHQRNGDVIDTTLIRSIVASYVSLGLDEVDPTKPTIEVYREYFGKPFLAATEKYYKSESDKLIAEVSVSDYMRKAEIRLHEEEGRVELYLHQSSTTSLMSTCEAALIKAHSELLQDEFSNLLEQDRQADMTRMYKLLKRIPNGLSPLRNKFESHVRKSGLAAIDKIQPEKDEETVDPKEYVDALLSVHTVYNLLVSNSFQGDAEFVKSLDNACREYVNRNRVCKSASARSPELLAKYCDSLLKKNIKNVDESAVESTLQAIMIIFKYVEDKDVFQKFYTKHLARRLVNTTSASDDVENSMLTKLKEACGFEYTSKLQRMFADIATSKDLNARYLEHKESAETEDPFDTEFLVLGASFWPLTPTAGYSIPAAVQRSLDRYATFYHAQHTGRTLSWCWHLGKADIRTTFLSQKYTFTVSHYQLAVFCAFNEADSHSYENIQAITGIQDKVQLDGAMNLMLKARLILLGDGQTLGTPGSTYTLNKGYKHKKLKMSLNHAIKSEQKAESADTHKTVEEDRKLLTQSAIVRIMKARKQLKHTLLVQETISQVKNRFSPKIPDIKKCIDSLIEKEYLERKEKDEYAYLA